MTTRTRRLLLSTLILIAPVAALLSFLLVSDTPDPMPSHWNLHGWVDGSTGAGVLFTGFFAAALVVSLAAVLLLWLGRSGPVMPAVLAYTAWVLGLSYAQIPLVSHGAQSASAVDLPWWSVVAIIVLPALPALVTWRSAPWPAAGRTSAAATPMPLGDRERVVWIGSAHSTPLRGTAILGVIAAAALAFFAPVAAVVVGVVAVTVAGVATLSVRVDEVGLHTLWGPVGWPRTLVRLDDVAAVRAEEINPLAWGGWGYRVGRRGVAAVVRRGPGLVVDRRDRPTYAVTVDGADQGAAVLSALVSRSSGEPAGPPSR